MPDAPGHATERPIGFRHRTLPFYAVQYPIERNDPDGAQLLYNFATHICGAEAAWDEDAMILLAIERVREAAPEGRVLCAVSGGVDSAVCARLASMAVGDRLMCVFVDTGLFRQGEPENVISTFMDSWGLWWRMWMPARPSCTPSPACAAGMTRSASPRS